MKAPSIAVVCTAAGLAWTLAVAGEPPRPPDSAEGPFQEAALVKKIFLAFFRDRPDSAYTLRREPVRVDVGSEPTFSSLRRRVSFLGEPSGGWATFAPGRDMNNLFLQLSSAFYAALREAAKLSSCADPRIQVLADWGNNTFVHWPNPDGTDDSTTVRVLEWRDSLTLQQDLAERGPCRSRP